MRACAKSTATRMGSPISQAEKGEPKYVVSDDKWLAAEKPGGDGVKVKKVGTYAVSWWKVTTPERGTWAYAGQERPSLTLQTCVGAKSQYRLVVRLAKVGSSR